MKIELDCESKLIVLNKDCIGTKEEDDNKIAHQQ